MDSKEIRGYKAIQNTYSLLATKYNNDEYGYKYILPSERTEKLDTIEALLVSILIQIKESYKSNLQNDKLLVKIYPYILSLYNKVERNELASEIEPMEILTTSNKGKSFDEIISELTDQLFLIWRFNNPDNFEAIRKIQEICVINLDLSNRI